MIEEILPNVPLNFKTACNKDDGIRLVMKSKDTPNHLFSYQIGDYLYYTPIELSEDIKGTYNIFFQDKTDNLLVATRMEIAEIIENTDGTILFSGSINGEKGTAVFTKVDNDFVFGEATSNNSGSNPTSNDSNIEILQCYQNSDSGNCLYFNTSFSATGIIETNQVNQFFNVSSDGTKINGIAQTITENTGDRITNSGGTYYTRNKKLDVLVSAPNKLLEVEYISGANLGITNFNFLTNKDQTGKTWENYRFENSSYYNGTTECELVVYGSAGGPPSSGYYKVKK